MTAMSDSGASGADGHRDLAGPEQDWESSGAVSTDPSDLPDEPGSTFPAPIRTPVCLPSFSPGHEGDAPSFVPESGSGAPSPQPSLPPKVPEVENVSDVPGHDAGHEAGDDVPADINVGTTELGDPVEPGAASDATILAEPTPSIDPVYRPAEALPSPGDIDIPGPLDRPHPGTDPTLQAPPHPPVVSVVRPLPRIMAIANQKGGVGKTTTAVNLSAALAELGYRVLVVDLDPQGNATTGLGINAHNLQSSIYDVLLNDVSLEDCIEPTAVRNLFVAPATIDLAGAEIELVPAFSRELRLRRAIERLDGEYDFTLIDCPPSLGLLTINGLAAASEVVVPIQCEYYALEGLGQLLRNVQLVQSNLNPKLELGAIILTMYDARTKLSGAVVQDVRRHFGAKVCRHIVPRTVRLSEAPSFGQPIIVFDSTSRGAIAYRELAKEVSGGAPKRAG